MPNQTAPTSSIYTGWFYDMVNGRYDMYVRGTKVSHVNATELQVDQALDADGAANFAAEVECAANLHAQYTVEAGADGVGADTEQLTSGAGAAPDWA
jgi:hypothetical protein